MSLQGISSPSDSASLHQLFYGFLACNKFCKFSSGILGKKICFSVPAGPCRLFAAVSAVPQLFLPQTIPALSFAGHLRWGFCKNRWLDPPVLRLSLHYCATSAQPWAKVQIFPSQPPKLPVPRAESDPQHHFPSSERPDESSKSHQTQCIPPIPNLPPLRHSLSSHMKNISLPQALRGFLFSSTLISFYIVWFLIAFPTRLPTSPKKTLLTSEESSGLSSLLFFFPGTIFLAHFLMESLFLMDSVKSVLPQFLLSSAGEK